MKKFSVNTITTVCLEHFALGGPLTSARMAHRILFNQYLFATLLV